MKAPDFLVIGAQKAGSTWIYECLKQHPEVFMPEAVELLYFNKLNYADDAMRAEYFDHFKDADKYKRVGEKTPGYFWSTDRKRSLTQPPKGHNSDIPGAVKEILGDEVDFITSLRHPVWRAISAFGHHAKRSRINPEKHLREVVQNFGILDIGFYGAHLDSWINAVGRERLEVLIFEDEIASNPAAGYRKVCDFLKIESSFAPAGLLTASNAGVGRKMDPTGITVKGHPLPIGPDDIEYLIDAYGEDITRTKAILGNALETWDAETDRLREWCKNARPPKPKPKAAAPQHQNPSVQRNRDFLEHGLQASRDVTDGLGNRFAFEAPARLSSMSMRGACSFGAFSYAVSGNAYGTHIGRYCSISRSVNLGQFNHTMEWLSTSPFQFQQGFTFATGSQFPDKAAYDATVPDPLLSASARRELTRITTIGNDVWISHAAVLTAGVTIGDGAVIGAGSVVTKDVEPYEIVGGVPAKHIRYRFDAETRARLLKVKWWQYATWQLAGVPFSDVNAALTEIERRVAEEGMKPYAPGRLTYTDNGIEPEG